MEVRKNDISQFLKKMLHVIKNRRRRLILKAFEKSEVMSIGEVRKHLQAPKSSHSTITDSYLKPWIEVGVIEKKARGLYKITSFGKEISKIISEQKEFDLLRRPGDPSLFTELTLLELRDGKKRYQELMAKLGLSDPWKVIKKLKDERFLKVNHPENLIHVPHLFYFSVSPYLLFIEEIKNYVEKAGRSWFTEYAIIKYLNQKWKTIFNRPMDLNEVQELINKGIGKGGIFKKADGSYEVSIKDLIAPIENLTASEKRILNLIREEPMTASMIAEKSGLHFASAHKILKRLEKRDLIVRDLTEVTMELTEKGKRLADSLFEIKKCLAKEFGWKV